MLANNGKVKHSLSLRHAKKLRATALKISEVVPGGCTQLLAPFEMASYGIQNSNGA
jgi:hypothetical protein